MKSELTVPLIQLAPWRVPAECELPEALRPWLLEADSMTRRLRHHNHHFSVQLLGNRSVTLCADEQQLVAAEQPELVVLDEPTEHLDRETARELLDDLSDEDVLSLSGVTQTVWMQEPVKRRSQPTIT